MKTPQPSSKAALARMKAAKPKNTKPELMLRSCLHRKGLRFRIDKKPVEELNRRADIVFRSVKIAIFVDGCFWHGCPLHGSQSKSNYEFWKNKIDKNIHRDLDTNKQLERRGWYVVRVWEHEDLELRSNEIYEIYIKRMIKNRNDTAC